MARPNELDLVNSSAMTQGRIMEGVGVSRVVAGYAENANRAGSVVAHEIFYELVLNPFLKLLGQAMDAKIGPRYSQGGKRLRIWIDEAKANDAEALASRIGMAKEVFLVDELREFTATGTLTCKRSTRRSGSSFLRILLRSVRAIQTRKNRGLLSPRRCLKVSTRVDKTFASF